MPIVLVRVDDRLIHGQILEAWLPLTAAEELLIPNDAVAEDRVQQMILRAAVPRSVSVRFEAVERMADLFVSGCLGELRQMVIVDRPRDALRLKRSGVHFERLNVGNLMTDQAGVRLSRTVSVRESCLEDLCRILDEGVRVELQTVPYERPVQFWRALLAGDANTYRRVLAGRTAAAWRHEQV